MPIKLLIDPHTKRVVYAAYDGVAPERVMIIDGVRQYLFLPATCEQVIHAGALPSGFGPQKSWNFRYTENRLEPVAEQHSGTAQPERQSPQM
jgi:hypothetical protein